MWSQCIDPVALWYEHLEDFWTIVQSCITLYPPPLPQIKTSLTTGLGGLARCRYELFGIFMRNWDESEETGNQKCSVEEDHRDAKRVCSHLGIPLYEADFVDQYWNKVFSHFVAQYSKGLTPNPDLECNRSIKFGALLRHAQSLGADRVATGHYARLVPDMHGMLMHAT